MHMVSSCQQFASNVMSHRLKLFPKGPVMQSIVSLSNEFFAHPQNSNTQARKASACEASWAV